MPLERITCFFIQCVKLPSPLRRLPQLTGPLVDDNGFSFQSWTQLFFFLSHSAQNRLNYTTVAGNKMWRRQPYLPGPAGVQILSYLPCLIRVFVDEVSVSSGWDFCGRKWILTVCGHCCCNSTPSRKIQSGLIVKKPLVVRVKAVFPPQRLVLGIIPFVCCSMRFACMLSFVCPVCV